MISIGKIIKTHGNRGEVVIEPLTDFPERFERLKKAYLRFPGGHLREALLESFRWHKGRVVGRFSGYNSIAEAKLLVGCQLQIPEEELMPLPPDTYYDFQLVGCQVVDETGRRIGTVAEVLRFGANNLLRVRQGEKEHLIPAVGQICRSIDIRGRRIRVSLPPGLLDL